MAINRKYQRGGYKSRMKNVRQKKAYKQLNRLKRMVKNEVTYCHLTRERSENISSPYLSLGCDQFQNFVNIFGTLSNDEETNKAQHYRDRFDIEVSLENTINNEESTIQFTAYLVSLKDQIGPAFNASTGALTLTDGLHYTITGGQAYVNPNCFVIHKRKTFTLTNYGTDLGTSAAQTQYGTRMRWNWNLYRKGIINNIQGDWVSQQPYRPSLNAYVLIFNDNSLVDAESPVCNMNQYKITKALQ